MIDILLLAVLIALFILFPILWPVWAIGLVAVLAGSRHDRKVQNPKTEQQEYDASLGIYILLTFLFFAALAIGLFGGTVAWTR